MSFFSLLLSISFARYGAAQLPVGTSTVAGTAEYMGTAVATAPGGMPTLAWNCAKMPAICENVNSRNPLTTSGDGYGGLQSGAIELHYDVYPGNDRYDQRGKAACPKGWSSTNCVPGVSFAGSSIVCGNGQTLAGECFPGDLWTRTPGQTQCPKTPFISFPATDGGGPTGLIWSCDEWPPKTTVEGGAGANSACAPMRASVIGSSFIPPEVLAAENQYYDRSEQDYQADAQNALRAVVSGQKPAMLGIWAFEFNTFYDDSDGSYATRVTSASGSITGVISKREDNPGYISRLHMSNGTIRYIHHRRNEFDARGRLTHWEPESMTGNGISHYILFARSNTTISNSSTTSTTLVTRTSTKVISPHIPLGTGNIAQPFVAQNGSTSDRPPLGTGSPFGGANRPPLGTGNPFRGGIRPPLGTGSPLKGGARPPLGTGLLPTPSSNSTGGRGGRPKITLSPNGTVPLGTGTFPRPTNGSGPGILPLNPSDASDASLAATTTITPVSISTTLVPATIDFNTTITTTGPDGTPTVVPELVDCDVCAAAALIIFGIPPGSPPAVYDIPGVGLVPIGPDGAPLDASAAAAATTTTTAPDSSESDDGDSDSCELVLYYLGGDGESVDDSWVENTLSQPPPALSTSSVAAPPPPPPQETTQICAASRPEVDCTQDSDCSCPVIPGCDLVASCVQESAAQFRCHCSFPM